MNIQLTSAYLSRAELALMITLLAYFLLNGAQIFETAVLIPKWTAAPPESFSLLKGIDLKTFWIIAHSIHEVTFLAAIAYCWKIDIVRNWLLVLLVLHILVRAWTLTYFAPNIISFQSSDHLGAYTHDLKNRVDRWRNLNYLRVGIYVALSAGIIPLFLKVLNLKLN